MGPLSAKDERYLSATRRMQRPTMLMGLAFALLGSAYVTWAVLRYNPLVDPRRNPGFDLPIAQMGFIFDGYQKRLEDSEAGTRREAALGRSLLRNMSFSAGIMVLQLRILVGTVIALGGFAAMTVVIERRRLLALIPHPEPARAPGDSRVE